MNYSIKETDIINFANYVNIDWHRNGDEITFTYCPYCQGGNHHDKDTFGVNSKTGAFCCLRSSCGKKGHFVELARDFDFDLDFENTPKQFKKLKQPTAQIEPTEYAFGYLRSRGISDEISAKYEITTHRNNPGVLVFPFFDDMGKLQFIKYRNINFVKGKTAGSKEWCEADTKPILFGMKQCTDFSTLVITEGQIDSLSLATAGIKNAVSVPTGAKGFTWLPHCIDWINKFQTVIVMGDYENGSMTLLDTLQTRLKQRVLAVRPADYLGEKDANAILTNFGTEALVKCIENAEPPKINNVKELSSVESINLYDLEKVRTGFAEIDKLIKGVCMGQLMVIAGRQGEGKSTFLSQLIANALNQNVRTFAYSGELPDFQFKAWLDFQLAGSKYIRVQQDEYSQKSYLIDPKITKEISNWYKGKMYIYDNNFIPSGDETEEMEGILETVEKVIKQYDVKLICIDNLMTAMDSFSTDNIYMAQSQFVQKLKKLAIRFNVAIVLLVHMRKPAQGSKDNQEAYDISGSADIINRPDIVLLYDRLKDNKSRIRITKNRLFGSLETEGITLEYNPVTKRIFSANETKPMVYGWEKSTTAQPLAEELIPALEDDGELPF